MPKENFVEEIKRLTKNIEGWLTNSEGEYLYSLAKNGQAKGVIVEIGSWKGKATIWLAAGTKQAKREKVYAIDHHRGSIEHGANVWTYPEFERNIKQAGIDDVVVPIIMKSEEAARGWNKPIRLLWIDGDHAYESIKQDFLLWEPHLVKRGIIALHDTTMWPGPKRLAEEYICNSSKFRNMGFVASITFAEKTDKNCIADRLKNRISLFARDMSLNFRLPRYLRVFGRKILIALKLHPKIS